MPAPEASIPAEFTKAADAVASAAAKWGLVADMLTLWGPWIAVLLCLLIVVAILCKIGRSDA
jgi:hypothetical protein